MATIDRVVTSTTTEFSRSGTATYVIPETITRDLGNTVTDISLSAWMRKKDIFFKITGLKPNEYYFPFFDGVNVSGFVETCSYLFFHFASPDGYQHNSIISGHNFYFGQNGMPHEKIVGTQSGATAKVVWQDQGSLYIVGIEGKFMENEIVYGEQSHAWIKVHLFPQLAGFARGGTSNTITLDADSSDYDSTNEHDTFGSIVNIRKRGFALNCTICDGTGAGQIRRLSSYNGTTKVATIVGTWSIAPDSTSRYSLGPLLTGESGTVAGIFHLQDNTFHAGEKVLRFTSDRNNGPDPAAFAEQKYYAEGVTQTKTAIQISTRNLKVEQQQVTETFPSITALTDIDDTVQAPPPASVYRSPTSIQTINLTQQSTTVIPPTQIINNYYGRGVKVEMGNNITIQAACHPSVTSGVSYNSAALSNRWQVVHDYGYPSVNGCDLYCWVEKFNNGKYRLGMQRQCGNGISARSQSDVFTWPTSTSQLQNAYPHGHVTNGGWFIGEGHLTSYDGWTVDGNDPGRRKMVALARYYNQLHLCLFELHSGQVNQYVVADATAASLIPGYSYSPYVYDHKPLWYNPWATWYTYVYNASGRYWSATKTVHIANL
jgi:hypothetical protein